MSQLNLAHGKEAFKGGSCPQAKQAKDKIASTKTFYDQRAQKFAILLPTCSGISYSTA